jgi:hypothetical protein
VRIALLVVPETVDAWLLRENSNVTVKLILIAFSLKFPLSPPSLLCVRTTNASASHIYHPFSPDSIDQLCLSPHAPTSIGEFSLHQFSLRSDLMSRLISLVFQGDRSSVLLLLFSKFLLWTG